jgi:hypothetical protein
MEVLNVSFLRSVKNVFITPFVYELYLVVTVISMLLMLLNYSIAMSLMTLMSLFKTVELRLIYIK